MMLLRMMICGALGASSLCPAAAQGTRPLAAHPAPRAAAGPTANPAAPNEATVQARAEALTASMAKPLGLAPAQVEKVRLINLNAVRSVEVARIRYRQDPAKLRGYIDDVGQGRLEQLKDVLSPVQFQRYQQKREEKMGIPSSQGVQGNQPPGLGGRESN